MVFHEHTARSLVKAFTYRGIIFMSDGIIIVAITHRYDLAISFVLISNAASTLIYFLHERAWNKIHWGKAKHVRK